MSESLKHIKNRIRSIESIKKITRAMEMISLAKLRPSQNKLESSRRYLEKVRQLYPIPWPRPPARIILS